MQKFTVTLNELLLRSYVYITAKTRLPSKNIINLKPRKLHVYHSYKYFPPGERGVTPGITVSFVIQSFFNNKYTSNYL